MTTTTSSTNSSNSNQTTTPIAVLAPADELVETIDTLRDLASRHGDTAWVHPSPSTPVASLGNLSRDLINAIGAVGVRTPPSAGERHLLRATTHLIHGPVRHVIVDDANLLSVEALDALYETALVASVQLWLLFDASTRKARRFTHTDPHEWLAEVCAVTSPTALLELWRKRDDLGPCDLPPHTWWHQDPAEGRPWTDGCADAGAHPRPADQVDCFLALARRAMTAGHTTPTLLRRRITESRNHPDTTAEHLWALGAAGRDLLTPGSDALGHAHPDAQLVRLADVTPDGSSVHLGHSSDLDGTWVDIPEHQRLAVARLRTSRRLAGCVSSDGIHGVFDSDYGVYGSRRR